MQDIVTSLATQCIPPARAGGQGRGKSQSGAAGGKGLENSMGAASEADAAGKGGLGQGEGMGKRRDGRGNDSIGRGGKGTMIPWGQAWSVPVDEAQAELLEKILASTEHTHKTGCILSAMQRDVVLLAQDKWWDLYSLDKCEVSGQLIKELCSTQPEVPMENNGLREFLFNPIRPGAAKWQGVPFYCSLTGRTLYYRKPVHEYPMNFFGEGSVEQWDLGTEQDGVSLEFANQNVLVPRDSRGPGLQEFRYPQDMAAVSGGARMQVRSSVLTAMDPEGKFPLTYLLEPDLDSVRPNDHLTADSF
ncbi:unnamed protein product [Amoebophrya sp. A120]|nr:unnamed protein product [Amoebophrya sp. A120]|eukprot:GSA120T00001822001.1